MNFKTYYSESVEQAMAQARRELGADAMLVHSRRTAANGQHLGHYEVVFTTAAEEDQGSSKLAQPLPALDRIQQEMVDLRRHMERIVSSVHRSGSPSGRTMLQAVSEAVAPLIDANVTSGFAHEIGEAALRRYEAQAGVVVAGHSLDAARWKRCVRAELEARLNIDATLGLRVPQSGAGNKVVALVGPPGVGKTSTLVKLAMAYGLKARRPCYLLSLDTYRIAAAEQLRTYAAILGLGFQLLDRSSTLAQALEEHRNKELILIDTPGYGSRDMDLSAETAATLKRVPGIDVHLVLSAAMRTEDLSRVADRYQSFAPSKLLFTRLDETESAGALLNESLRLQRPISFLTTGQNIPEDLEPATKSGLIHLLLRSEQGAAGAAA